METQTVTATDSKLKEFFIDQLEDLLWAEKKLVKTLPKLQEAATSTELKDAFGNHLAETQNHVSRLEQVFDIIGEEVDTTKCPAMAGIIDEGEDIIDDTEEGTAQRDVGLIFAGQKAEHYEIATYGGMVTLAKTLGYDEASNLLLQTLEEEKMADELLTQIAENNINYQASTEPSEEKGGIFS
jgi:ferritin-like metal-binding protein YciE